MGHAVSIPSLEHYTASELEAAKSWPAVDRYLGFLARNPKTDSHTEAPQASVDHDLAKNLRLRRHRAWTESALALFHNRATDRDVCAYWSQAATRHIREAALACGFKSLGISVLALGKLGADELNLSSDVDLIFLADDERTDEALEQQTRAAKSFIKLLSEPDEWGFCHRVDVTIRPGGPQSPLVPTISQFQNHYGYHGEVWERLALIRLQPISLEKNRPEDRLEDRLNDRESEVQKFSNGFSFRRHLDYSVLEELRLLLSRIRSEHQPRTDGSLHLKLQAGCIRDLELFTHALLCIHGGRRPELRTRSTEDALSGLAKAGLMSHEECQFLIQTYWKYRGIENRLQAFADEQTYKVTNPEDIVEIQTRASRVQVLSESSFPPLKTATLPSLERLVESGFDLNTATDALNELQASKALSKKSERDERERTLFLSEFLEDLAKTAGDRNLGLGLLVDFVKATRAKATLFSLLNREPTLRRQLVRLFSESPWAGNILSSRPELLDSLLLRQDVNLREEFELNGDMAQALENLAERRLTGELVAILHFLETRDLEACTENLTNLADQIVADLMYLSAKEIGCEPLGVVALGKWGGRELGVRSDLDFIFFTSSSPTAEQQRLARRFLNRMTEAHRGGSLYAVDMRLRPSGHAGPMLVQEESLVTHLNGQAEAWERQSWLRARSVPGLPHPIPASIKSTILARGLSPEDKLHLSEIALKLFKPIPMKSKRTLVDLKLTHGGLAPIEFAAQIAILQDGTALASTIGTNSPSGLETSTRSMVQFLEEQSVSNREDWKQLGPRLREVHGWIRSLEQAARITGDSTGSVLHLESSEFTRLAHLVVKDQTSSAPVNETLASEILATLDEVAKSLQRLGR